MGGSLVTFYYYTSVEELQAIMESGVINERPFRGADAAFGQGKRKVYQF